MNDDSDVSLLDLFTAAASAIARAESAIAGAKVDKILAGKALLAAQKEVYRRAGNQPPAMQKARWVVLLADAGIGSAIARQCMKLAAAPDPEQALSDLQTEARERAAARKARRIVDDERGLPATLIDLLRELQDALDAESFEVALQQAVTAARQSRGRRAA